MGNAENAEYCCKRKSDKCLFTDLGNTPENRSGQGRKHMDLNIIVAEKTQEMVENGTVEKMIVEKIESTIKQGIDDALRSYSDFGRSISEKISQSIQQASRHVTIPVYNQFIADIVQEQYSKVLNESAVEHLNKLISDKIITVNKEENLAVLFEKIEELWREEAQEKCYDAIDVEHSYNDDDTWLKLVFKHPQFSFYNVEVILYTSEYKDSDTWNIGSIKVNDKRISGHPLNAAGVLMDEVGRIIYQYYAMQTEFTIDPDYEIEDIYVGD